VGDLLAEKEERREDYDIDKLFDGILKPLHSRNARQIFETFYHNRAFEHLTTYDLEKELEDEGLPINKKEINSWLISLQDAGLILKMEERGKPVRYSYEDKYTYDLWRLTDTGLNVGERLPNLMADVKIKLPHLIELTPAIIHELEDLYYTAKILTLLHEYGGSLDYATLRKQLALDREKLAVYSWPDTSHSEKPLFEVKVKPSTLRAKVFKLFGWVVEQDLYFTLTDDGRKIAEDIVSRGSPA
jgi:DNA-binding transcriptional ArsR family regulator